MTDFKSLFESIFDPVPQSEPTPTASDYRVVKSEVLKEIIRRSPVLVRVGDQVYRVTAAPVEVTSR